MAPTEKRPKSASAQLKRSGNLYGTAGLEVVLAVIVGYALGSYLDNRWGTSPWLTLIWSAAGVGAAIKAMVRMARQYKADVRANQKEEGPGDDAPRG